MNLRLGFRSRPLQSLNTYAPTTARVLRVPTPTSHIAIPSLPAIFIYLKSTRLPPSVPALRALTLHARTPAPLPRCSRGFRHAARISTSSASLLPARAFCDTRTPSIPAFVLPSSTTSAGCLCPMPFPLSSCSLFSHSARLIQPASSAPSLLIYNSPSPLITSSLLIHMPRPTSASACLPCPASDKRGTQRDRFQRDGGKCDGGNGGGERELWNGHGPPSTCWILRLEAGGVTDESAMRCDVECEGCDPPPFPRRALRAWHCDSVIGDYGTGRVVLDFGTARALTPPSPASPRPSSLAPPILASPPSFRLRLPTPAHTLPCSHPPPTLLRLRPFVLPSIPSPVLILSSSPSLLFVVANLRSHAHPALRGATNEVRLDEWRRPRREGEPEAASPPRCAGSEARGQVACEGYESLPHDARCVRGAAIRRLDDRRRLFRCEGTSSACTPLCTSWCAF
ncbi:hypothetical protein DFH09DRAFT_1438014 [Mycena vulgaris]|nr:hypothetical protein DFH09DRAFT_1438014 [Mycena vulgaris]